MRQALAAGSIHQREKRGRGHGGGPSPGYGMISVGYINDKLIIKINNLKLGKNKLYDKNV